MSRRFSRISLALALMLSSEVWALGLGDIRLESALNEPFRAEIELLSATPEELTNLQVAMASSETFERYGLERPFYLQGIEFNIVPSGRADGNVVQARSRAPMTEPFLTFLVEATWSRGRLLREYTVLLDPPTYAPPTATQAEPAVAAPQRSTPADSGRIERQAPPQSIPSPTPTPAPAQSQAPVRSTPTPTPQPARSDEPYDSTAGGEFYVERGATLWGITQRVRPDSRLTINQTMVAIFEANPQAFGGNINLLRAGASLRIPSADEIFRISRGDALSEVRRQEAAWEGDTVAPPVDTSTRPSLTLVPPDEDLGTDEISDAVDSQFDDEPLTREQEIEDRIADLETADVPEQQSLIEIRDNELASLREELARIRGEVYEPPVDGPFVDDSGDEFDDDVVADDEFADTDDIMADDGADIGDSQVLDDEGSDVVDTTPPPNVITTQTRPEPGLVDKIISALTGIWAIIIGALVIAVGVLVWFMRRGRDEEEQSGAWQELDADDAASESLSATETLHAPRRDEGSFVVVEQDSAIRPIAEDTIETPAPEFQPQVDDTGSFDSLEDTFSSDTAVNLDQSDPVAEADFHMAYGLYDQAADLINGALDVEPERQDLLTKLCEVYFVWGNRDAFVDAAGRVKSVIGGQESADWDKIVIMGQQIAPDHNLFAGAGTAAATRAVDLSFEAGADEAGALDMEFLADTGASSDIIDLGGDDEASDGVDFLFDDSEAAGADPAFVDLDVTGGQSPLDATVEVTAEMPSAESTVETPTIEEQFDVLGGTAELPAIDAALGDAITTSGQAADATAEINLDDLGLDFGDLPDSEIESFDDPDATSENAVLSATGSNEALDDLTDTTGKNPRVDPNASGVLRGPDIEDFLGETAEMNMADETGRNSLLDLDPEATEVGFDESLLDATGMTQVLSDEYTVETASDVDALLSDEDATMLAPGDGDDDETLLSGFDEDEVEFDFAKTEALPKDAFTDDSSLDVTGELPAVASTDVDLDLDDLTAALKVSEMGDTLDQPRDDKTVEQPRPNVAGDNVDTMAFAPGDMNDDLDDARTMTEVGTKLDLARAYVDMGDPTGARSILEEVLDEGDEGQRQQAQQLLDSLPT